MHRKRINSMSVLARLRLDLPLDHKALKNQRSLLVPVHRLKVGESLRENGHDTRNLYLVPIKTPETKFDGAHGRSFATSPKGKSNRQMTLVMKGTGASQNRIKSESESNLSKEQIEIKLKKSFEANGLFRDDDFFSKLAENEIKRRSKFKNKVSTDSNVKSIFEYVRWPNVVEQRYIGLAREETITNAIENANLLRNELVKLKTDPFVRKYFSITAIRRVSVMNPIAVFDLQQVPLAIKNPDAFIKKYSKYLSLEEKKAIKNLKGARWFKLMKGLAATSLKGKIKNPIYFAYSVPLNHRIMELNKFRFDEDWRQTMDYYGINLTKDSLKTGKVYSRIAKKFVSLNEVKKELLFVFSCRLALSLYAFDVRLGGSLSSQGMSVFSGHNITASSTLLDLDTAGFYKNPKAAHNAVITDFNGLIETIEQFAKKLRIGGKDLDASKGIVFIVWQEYMRTHGIKRIGKI
ncbi:MAG: hypothetical protein PHQ98_00565 [Candidatus ainarchaeum sp.]|nr:hypothetical protein [Candidatus ainarchaeum sp.]